MEDATPLPPSAFVQSGAEIPAWLDAALGELRQQVDPTPILDELEARAERDGHLAALAAGYAAIVETERLAVLPERARLAIWLRAARLANLDAPARLRLAERYVAAAASGGTERQRRLLEQGLAVFESVEASSNAGRLLRERLVGLPAATQSEQALLLTAKAGGKDAEAALVALLERWLQSGTATEGVTKLPRNVAAFQSELTLDLLERLFAEASASEAYVDLLERRSALEAIPARRARSLEKLARFRLEQGANPEAAESYVLAAAAYEAAAEVEDAERAYEQALAVSPDQLSAAERLVSLRAKAGNFAAAAEAFGAVLRLESDSAKVCELLLSISADAERAAAASEFAELADDVSWRLGSDDRELAQRLLRHSARLHAAEGRYDEAAQLYRRLIADQATSEDLDGYQALIDSNPTSSWRSNHQRWLFEWQEHHSADRPTVLLSWARFEEQELGDPALAQSVLERAAQLAPDRPEIWENLTRLRLAAGDGAGGVSASHELRRLGREPDATLLELLLEHEPGARWAIDRVKLKLSAEARWAELFELYDRAIEATSEDGERAAWLNEAAIAARDVAQDPERAIGYWEQYTSAVPSDLRADKALERLYEQAEDKAALLVHLQRRRARPGVSDPRLLDERIVGLALELGALADALSAIDRLSGDAPETISRYLEQVFARSLELGGSGEARAAGEQAARRLRQAYLEREKPEEAARLLRAELELELEPSARRRLLAELSSLSETKLADLAAAFEAQRELFLSSLAGVDRERLETLGRARGGFLELCETLALAAEAETTLAGKRALLRRAAELASLEARDLELATRLYGQMFQLEPEQAHLTFESLSGETRERSEPFEALCRLLEASGQFDQLAAALERRARQNQDSSSFSRLGRLLADQLGDAAAAIDAHLLASDARTAGQVFLRQPSVFGDDGSRALSLAEQLHAAGLTEGSLLVLRHQLAFYAERAPAERKPLTLALVKLLQECGAHEAARDELVEAARHFPTDAEVQRACAKSAARAADWEAAEQYYRTLLLLRPDRKDATTLQRASVYVELAKIKLERDDPAAAGELMASAFEAGLGSAPELTALAESLLEHGLNAEAERAIHELLQLAADLPTAARALGCLARLSRGGGHEVPKEHRQRAAELAESVAGRYAELADPRERSDLIAACIGSLPLERAEALLREARDALAPEQAAEVRLELARRLLDSTEPAARGRAVTELTTLLAHPSAELGAWPLLVRALEQDGRIDELKSALAARLERAPSDVDALSAALRLALSQGHLPGALALYERLARAGERRDAELSARLCRLLLEAGDDGGAVRLLQSDAEREPDPEAKAKLLVEAAELTFAQGDVTQAQASVSEARRVDPSSAEAVLLAAKLALAGGRRLEALEALNGYAESKQRRRGRALAQVLRLAADLRLQRDELSEALPLLLEAHQLDETDLDAALRLGLLAIDLDRLDTASVALRAVVAARETGNRDLARSLSVAQSYFQLARIEQHHGKKINAKRMALRALEENPNLVPAQRLLSQLGPH